MTPLEALEKLKSMALFEVTEFDQIQHFEDIYQTVKQELKSQSEEIEVLKRIITARDATIKQLERELNEKNIYSSNRGTIA